MFITKFGISLYRNQKQQLKLSIMKATIKIYKVSSMFSSREIQARNKKEAISSYLRAVPTAQGEKLTIN